MNFISFDLETTGLKSQIHGITEVAFLKFQKDKVVDKFVSLINPEQPISDKIRDLTGIDQSMVKDQPTFKDVAPKISEFIGDELLVAYNSPFDKKFLNVGFYKAGIHHHFNPLACTMRLTIEEKRLDFWPNFMNALQIWRVPVVGDGFHRAEFDAYLNGLLFNKMIKKMGQGVIEESLHPMKIPSQKYNPDLYEAYVKVHGEPHKYVPYNQEDEYD